ncbi:hypothetical protein C0J52_01631 [Blattella germanica]|nr:hypothetical protein C0J52_01631 [Blattella germanica]
MQSGNDHMKEEGKGRMHASFNRRMYWQSSGGGNGISTSVREGRTAEDGITLNLIGTEDNFNMRTCFETKANKINSDFTKRNNSGGNLFATLSAMDSKLSSILLSLHKISLCSYPKKGYEMDAEGDLIETSALSKCSQLVKLYLYSNKILRIPNLTACKGTLQILWLAGNQISCIEVSII